jgi:hypothetical protein
MIDTMITQNEKLQRYNSVLWSVLVLTLLCASFATYTAVKYKLKYDRRVEIGLEYNACCAKKKCTANYWQDITGLSTNDLSTSQEGVR